MSKYEIYLTTFKANIIEIFSVGEKTEYAEGWRTYIPCAFILEIFYANEYNLHLFRVSSFAAKYITISCVIRNSYISVTAFNAPVLYRHDAQYLPNMVTQEVTFLTFVRDATGSSRGRDTDEPGVLRGLPRILRANFGIIP